MQDNAGNRRAGNRGCVFAPPSSFPLALSHTAYLTHINGAYVRKLLSGKSLEIAPKSGPARLRNQSMLDQLGCSTGERPINPIDVTAVHMQPSSLTILVLEDNLDLQEFVCTALNELGHQPHAASTAAEASELLDAIHFDVLLADINLPGMLGSDFARLAVRKMPDIKVIFASGFGYLVSEALDFDVTLLHKPYTINQLKSVLEEPPKKRAA